MDKLCLTLVLTLILLLSGCIQLPSEQGIKYVCSDGTVVENKSLCPTTGTGGAPTPEVQEITLETELKVCSEMPFVQREYQTILLEDFCLIGLAAKHENTSLCRKISSDQRMNCYVFVAELANNADICLEAGAQRDQCYEQYSRDLKDASVCDKISDVNYKDSCYSNMAGSLGDATLCDKIRNVNQKDSCYINIAMRFSDVSYCQKIVNSNQKENCLQNLENVVRKV